MPGQKYSRINIRIFLVLSLLQGPQTHVAPVPVALQIKEAGASANRRPQRGFKATKVKERKENTGRQRGQARKQVSTGGSISIKTSRSF